MRRLFWVAVGAAGGIWAYQRGSEALARAKERGVVGNLTAATATATKVASTAGRAVNLAATQGARVGARLAATTAEQPATADRRSADGTPRSSTPGRTTTDRTSTGRTTTDRTMRPPGTSGATAQEARR